MLLTNAFMPDPRPHREALSLIEAGYSVKILCWDRGEGFQRLGRAMSPRENVDGIEVERVFLRSVDGRGSSQIFFVLPVFCRMFVRALKEDVDLIYCHDLDALSLGYVLSIFKRKKLVFDSHEVYSRMVGKNLCALLAGFIRWLERFLVRRVDLVITTCPAMTELYESYGARKVLMVSSWKDPRDFEFSREKLEEEKKKLGIGDQLVLSYIAHLTPDRIIEPLLDVVKEDEELVAVVGGHGAKLELVRRAAEECDRIKCLGFVAGGDVPLYTAISDVVYYGFDKESGMAEFNAPNKLFEALAAGKAFIGGDFGYMGEVIRDEECGVALDKFTMGSVKKAVSVMKDRQKLGVFQANAEKAALEKYNWQKAEEGLRAAIAELAGK